MDSSQWKNRIGGKSAAFALFAKFPMITQHKAGVQCKWTQPHGNFRKASTWQWFFQIQLFLWQHARGWNFEIRGRQRLILKEPCRPGFDDIRLHLSVYLSHACKIVWCLRHLNEWLIFFFSYFSAKAVCFFGKVFLYLTIYCWPVVDHKFGILVTISRQR